MIMLSRAIVAPIVLAVLAYVGVAGAVPVFRVELDDGNRGNVSSSSEVSLAVSVPEGPTSNGNFTQLDLFGTAGPDGLGASAHANIFRPEPALDLFLRSSIQSNTTVRATFDDLLISGPLAPGTFIPAMLNLQLDGALSANAVNIGGGCFTSTACTRVTARASVDLGVNFLGGSEDFVGHATRFFGASSNANGTTTTVNTMGASGILADFFDGDDIFTTPQVFLPVGQPFSLSLRLRTGVEARAPDLSVGNPPSGTFLNAEAQSSFDDTLTFPFSGPVFALPDGFTIDSESALIVSNNFVGGAPASVPEPASLVLVGAGFIVLTLRRRRYRS